jgi:hypothetical protein
VKHPTFSGLRAKLRIPQAVPRCVAVDDEASGFASPMDCNCKNRFHATN